MLGRTSSNNEEKNTSRTRDDHCVITTAKGLVEFNDLDIFLCVKLVEDSQLYPLECCAKTWALLLLESRRTTVVTKRRSVFPSSVERITMYQSSL